MISSAGSEGQTTLLPLCLIGTLVFLMLCSTTGPVLAQDRRAQTWDIHSTDHFDIYYQSQQRSHVNAVAREAERAYTRISFSLRHGLAAKMPLILVREDRDLPRNEQQARVLVTASGAPERDHLLVSAETFDRHPRLVSCLEQVLHPELHLTRD